MSARPPRSLPPTERDGEPIRGLRAAVRTFELSAPLHPILVHFTIALTSTSLAFDVLARVFNVVSLRDAAWWTIAASVVVTVATLFSGVTSRLRLPIEEGEARSYLRGHMFLGPLFFGLLVAVVIWRGDIWYRRLEVSWWYLAALAIAAMVMTVQGYLGGELVYRYGAEVEGHYRPLPIAERSDDPVGAVTDRP